MAAPRMPMRHLLLASASLLALALAQPAKAQDATWLVNPGSGDFTTGANWNPGTPSGTAFFDTSSVTALSLSSTISLGGFTFNPGASNYSLTNGVQLFFTGAGIDVQGGSLTIVNTSQSTFFYNGSTAGGATIVNAYNSSSTFFRNTSTAGNASLHNNGNGNIIYFYDSSTAGSASITNDIGSDTSGISFNDTSTAASASITNNGGGTVFFHNSSTAGSATIDNSGFVAFVDTSSAGNATITNSGGRTLFFDNSSGGTARLIANAGGAVDFSFLTSAGTTAGSFEGDGRFNLGSKTLTVGGNDLSTTVSGVIADGGTNGGTGGALVKTGRGTLTLTGSNTYTGGTTINGGTLQIGDVANMGKILNAVTVNTSSALEVVNADTSGITAITINDGTVNFRNATSAGSVAIA